MFNPFQGNRYEDLRSDDDRINYETPVTAKELFEKHPQFIEHEFAVLYRATYTRNHEKRLYNPQSIRQFNRYTDILTYKGSRVVLDVAGSALGEEDDYINACFVDVSFGFVE